MTKQYNTRVAPSPTGFIHLGNIRTAYHSWLAARSSGGKFILRIDDTDNNRNDEQYVQKIYDAMDWLGLDHDLTFRQSDKFDSHREIAQQFVDNGLATVVDGGAIALNSIDMPDSWTDKIAGPIKISDKDRDVMNGLIIIRSDKVPTYNFCSIIDDVMSGVNLIVRGTDHISNTPKQLAVLKALGKLHNKDYCSDLEFAHVGLVFEKGAKLSKRSGNSNLDNYKENGVEPEAILNWILRLGWSPKDANFDSTHQVIPKEMAKQIFWNDGNLKSASSSLDINKLNFYNKKFKNLKK